MGQPGSPGLPGITGQVLYVTMVIVARSELGSKVTFSSQRLIVTMATYGCYRRAGVKGHVHWSICIRYYGNGFLCGVLESKV